MRWEMQELAIDARSSRFYPLRDGSPVARADFFDALATEPACRRALTDTLAKHPLVAYFFETPPIDDSLSRLRAEFVLVDSPALASVKADPSPFADALAKAPLGPVARFPNLSGDAWLVVPRAVAPTRVYPQLARFVREAPAEQIDALWAQLGAAVADWRATRRERLWVSTSGLGVYWLHLRLDTRPKYYSFAEYRRA